MIKLLYPGGRSGDKGGRGAENGGSVNGASMPPMPCRMRRLQSFHEVCRWLHVAFVCVEIETDLQRLTAVYAGSLAVAAAQRNARRSAHRRNRAPVGVAVQRDLDRRTHFAEDCFRIKSEGNEAHRPIYRQPEISIQWQDPTRRASRSFLCSFVDSSTAQVGDALLKCLKRCRHVAGWRALLATVSLDIFQLCSPPVVESFVPVRR